MVRITRRKGSQQAKLQWRRDAERNLCSVGATDIALVGVLILLVILR